MRPYRPFLFLFLPLLVATSCRDDFTLEGDFQDVPTAYAYFDADDERHFVRVQKAFLESGGNALDIAGIADSIYYAPGAATVLVQHNGQTVELERVDGRDFGLEREDGIFATQPNVLYTFTADQLALRGGQDLELRIQRPGEPDAVATTEILSEIDIISPREDVDVRIENPDRTLAIGFLAPDAAAVFDIRVVMRIRELFPDNPAANRTRELTYVLNENFTFDVNDRGNSGRIIFDTPNVGFYQFLGSALEVDNRVRRRFLDFDIVITAVGEEVLAEQRLANANAGITSAQALPRFTNLEGGIGLVTSQTSTVLEGLSIDGGSIDSLQEGQFTRQLGF